MADANKLCRGLFKFVFFLNPGETAGEVGWLNALSALIGSNPSSNERTGLIPREDSGYGEAL
jgi:hypothetical protein